MSHRGSNKYHHLNHAIRSKQLFDRLQSTKYIFWLAIIGFYLALHVVDALLSDRNQVARNHKSRFQLIRAHLKHVSENFRADYKTLFNLAYDARYEATSYLIFGEQELEQIKQILDDTFIPILLRESKNAGIRIN